jgi:hypothetical protein
MSPDKIHGHKQAADCKWSCDIILRSLVHQLKWWWEYGLKSPLKNSNQEYLTGQIDNYEWWK